MTQHVRSLCIFKFGRNEMPTKLIIFRLAKLQSARHLLRDCSFITVSKCLHFYDVPTCNAIHIV
jgi:hypothetical protein